LECQDQADFVYLHWIKTSNDDVKGGDMALTGISQIDDIFVTG
jgi:hypothetical protein